MASLPRSVNPATNPTGVMSAIGTIYATAVMLYNAVYHHGVVSIPVIIAAIGAFGSLLARFYVTPVTDPHDNSGNLLVPASAAGAPAPPGPVPGGGSTDTSRIAAQPVGLPVTLPPEPPPPA